MVNAYNDLECTKCNEPVPFYGARYFHDDARDYGYLNQDPFCNECYNKIKTRGIVLYVLNFSQSVQTGKSRKASRSRSPRVKKERSRSRSRSPSRSRSRSRSRSSERSNKKPKTIIVVKKSLQPRKVIVSTKKAEDPVPMEIDQGAKGDSKTMANQAAGQPSMPAPASKMATGQLSMPAPASKIVFGAPSAQDLATVSRLRQQTYELLLACYNKVYDEYADQLTEILASMDGDVPVDNVFMIHLTTEFRNFKWNFGQWAVEYDNKILHDELEPLLEEMGEALTVEIGKRLLRSRSNEQAPEVFIHRLPGDVAQHKFYDLNLRISSC